jgi:catalase
MPDADATRVPYNPFNLTKVWPQGDYPLIEVGEWELNRNPENYFAEVEQAAFAPSRVVPGIGFSPDKMLHGRLFSYTDAQHYRLGVNHQMIPVNAPRCPVHSYHRDGAMRVDGNYGSTVHYEPNRFGEWQEQPDYGTPPAPLGDVAAFHWNFRDDDHDYYTQPGNLFRKMNAEQRQALFDNTARSMEGVSDEIQQRWIGHCALADPAYGAGVAQAVAVIAQSNAAFAGVRRE